MKILLISGHGAGDSGAVGCGRKEAELTRQATNILDGKFAAYDVIAKRYPVSHDAYQDNRNGSLATHLTDYDLVIEVHFNSYNGEAHGTEVLYKPSAMRSLAAKVSDAIADVGFYDRGAKRREDLMNMNTCARLGVPYILIETCFIDNRPDMNKYEANIYEVWGEVAAAVCKYYDIEKLASAGEPVKSSKTSTSKKKPAKPKKKSLSTVAKEVISGKWGNGVDRTEKLKKAGYSAAEIKKIQAEVNRRLSPKKKSIDTVAREVINGKWGDGSARVKKLKAAGYDPAAVQRRVNALLK